MDERPTRAIRRFPFVTMIVVVVTAAVNAAQLASSSVLAHLERTPAGLHGDWWRTATSLFVQDGGVVGTLSNLAFLLAVGVAAEQVSTRPKWFIGYFGAGLVGEFVGYAWQPVGGGNSVAVCGLAGIVAVAAWRGDTRMPGFGVPAALLWVGALLATWWPPLIAIGVVATGLAIRLAHARWRPLGAAVLTFVLACGVALSIDRNIHGAALVAGIVIAFTTYRRYPPPTTTPRATTPTTTAPTVVATADGAMLDG